MAVTVGLLNADFSFMRGAGCAVFGGGTAGGSFPHRQLSLQLFWSCSILALVAVAGPAVYRPMLFIPHKGDRGAQNLKQRPIIVSLFLPFCSLVESVAEQFFSTISQPFFINVKAG